jgi:dTDP-D-glucose 4,6-dehydratase
VRHLTIKYPNDYNIVSFDKLDYCSSLNNARMLESKPNFSFFHGDVTIPGDVIRCLQKHNIDTIFHLAAHTHVDLSFGNSYIFTKNNVFGTHVLLESIKEYGKIQRFYHISTDEVCSFALTSGWNIMLNSPGVWRSARGRSGGVQYLGPDKSVLCKQSSC